jgi:hypothetical protein
MLVTRRKALCLLPCLPFATLCGCQSICRTPGEYGPIKQARFVHFSHQFHTQFGRNQCAVTVRPANVGAVRLDFATLGVALSKEVLQASQILTGNLPLKIQSPMRSIGFANQLRVQVHKSKGFHVTIISVLAGNYQRLDFSEDQEIHHKTFVQKSRSLMPWLTKHGWQDPPPFSLAIKLSVERETEVGEAAVIVEALDIQAIEV